MDDPMTDDGAWIVPALAGELARPSRDKWLLPRLHYSRDLDPSGCRRRTWYAVRFPEETLALEKVLTSRLGDLVEEIALNAMARAGRLLDKQIRVKPLRPSAWCWEGTADALVRDPDGELCVVEVKSVEPEIARVLYETRSLALVKRERHAWQLGAYRHALAERLGANLRHRILFVPRGDGPVVWFSPPIPTVGEIVAQEEDRARLLPIAGAGSLDVPEPPRLEPVQRPRKKTLEAPPSCAWCAWRGRCQIDEAVAVAERHRQADEEQAAEHARQEEQAGAVGRNAPGW